MRPGPFRRQAPPRSGRDNIGFGFICQDTDDVSGQDRGGGNSPRPRRPGFEIVSTGGTAQALARPALTSRVRRSPEHVPKMLKRTRQNPSSGEHRRHLARATVQTISGGPRRSTASRL